MNGRMLFKFMLGLLSLTTMMLLTGCATATGLSHGSVPCQEQEMEIIDEQKFMGNPTTWAVICHGKTYYCSARYGGQYSTTAVNCVEADE